MDAGEVKEPPILLWFLLLQLSRSRVQLVSNLTRPPRGLSVHFIGQLPKALSARPKRSPITSPSNDPKIEMITASSRIIVRT